MAREVSRGEIWGFRFAAPDKKRPVLVISRQEVIDHVQTVERARLVGYVGHVSSDKMRDVCRALAVAVGCDA